jgi:hypothetical protein
MFTILFYTPCWRHLRLYHVLYVAKRPRVNAYNFRYSRTRTPIHEMSKRDASLDTPDCQQCTFVGKPFNCPSRLLPLSLANLCRVTSLDSSDRSPRLARIAADEIQPILSLAQFRVRRSACFASHVFPNVAPQDILNLFLLEPALDDQSSRAIDRSARTQFSCSIR